MSRRALLLGGVAVTAGAVGAGLGVAQGELPGRPWLQARLGLNGEAGLVPGDTRAYRPRMEFASWIARMRTPEVNVAAIRALQGSAPVEIAAHFAIEADGSFLLDSVLIEARPR